jgi:hypothetical protein
MYCRVRSTFGMAHIVPVPWSSRTVALSRWKVGNKILKFSLRGLGPRSGEQGASKARRSFCPPTRG